MKAFSNKKKLRSYREFLYILPFIILVAIFSYYPLYGWAYAFYDYVPPNQPTVADPIFKWFQKLFSNEVQIKNTVRVLRNTFAISGINLLCSWFPMIFAVFLNEIKCRPFKKFVQTVTTLPNFISWVLVFSIAFNVFSTTGVVNEVLKGLGLIEQPINFLQSSEHKGSYQL